MNERIQELVCRVGTDTSGKWISVDNAEKFAMLVIQAYNEELRQSQRDVKTELGYSRSIAAGTSNISNSSLSHCSV
jgi:hypothetical protein